VSFRIRPFHKADFETLWQIDQACFDSQLAYSRPEMAFYMRRTGAFTLVAEENQVGHPNNGGAGPPTRILGFIVAEVRGNSGHVITIDVIAEARRFGVGSALLAAAENQLRERGALDVALETAVDNEGAIRFYKQHGYLVEKAVRGYYSNQLDALVMGKALTGNE
jgi:[ribosomal protein S18]-alanine N-acetyltransferase